MRSRFQRLREADPLGRSALNWSLTVAAALSVGIADGDIGINYDGQAEVVNKGNDLLHGRAPFPKVPLSKMGLVPASSFPVDQKCSLDHLTLCLLINKKTTVKQACFTVVKRWAGVTGNLFHPPILSGLPAENLHGKG
jgi:hypothetical protein